MKALEGAQGPEGPAQLELLNEAQHHEQQRDNGEQVCARKALERADDRDHGAEQGDDQQSRGVDPAALDERAQLFPVERFLHEKGFFHDDGMPPDCVPVGQTMSFSILFAAGIRIPVNRHDAGYISDRVMQVLLI